MCYYNAQQLKGIKNIKLKQIEKQLSDHELKDQGLFSSGSMPAGFCNLICRMGLRLETLPHSNQSLQQNRVLAHPMWMPL